MSRDRLWIGLLIGYFLLQAVIRPLYGPALELDEAEAFWYSRSLAPGYGAQPPLYFWLQWGFLQLFGTNLWAISALKAALLGGTAALLFRFLRPVMAADAAATAVMALGLLPEISWESQRALTHSVLVLFLSVLALTAMSQALRSARLTSYLWLGVVLGFGFLSKFNFALVAAGLFAAVLTDRQLRASLRPAGVCLGLLVAAAMTLPYALWAMQHPQIATGSLHKLEFTGNGPIAARLSGLFMFIVSVVSLIILPALVLGPQLWRAYRRNPTLDLTKLDPRLRLMVMAATISMALVLVAVVVFGMAEVRSRWIMPLFWMFVPVGIALIWPGLTQKGRSLTTAVCGLVWLFALAGLLAMTCNTYRVADIATPAQGLPPALPVVSDNVWLLGNLAFLDDGRPLALAKTFETPASGTKVILISNHALPKLARSLGLDRPTGKQTLDIAGGQRLDQFEWAIAVAP